MHVRWSALRGTLVLDEDTQDCVGILARPLVDPDTGSILGFFVRTLPSFTGDKFLSTQDILSVGTKVHIRSADMLSPPGEIIRLQKHLEDPRPFFGQHIRIRSSGKSLGRCSDVQFDTRHFLLEWMFPRGLFFFGQPIAASEIIEVTVDAIWIKEPLREQKEKLKKEQKEITRSLIPEITPSM